MAKRVYFAFHYQDVIDFRANVVRNHNLLGGIGKAGYYDASIWESAKKQSALAVKRMINSELYNTSVTVVLIGSHTWARRWVRYEIIKSIERGNRVVGININNIPDKMKQTKSAGPDPFDNLALTISDDGRTGTPLEWDGSKWVFYSDLGGFDINEQPVAKRGQSFQLSHWLPTYDWVINCGYVNFSTWIE